MSTLPDGYEGFWPEPATTNTMTVVVDPEPATLATEAEAYNAWCDEIAAAGIVLGPLAN